MMVRAVEGCTAGRAGRGEGLSQYPFASMAFLVWFPEVLPGKSGGVFPPGLLKPPTLMHLMMELPQACV